MMSQEPRDGDFDPERNFEVEPIDEPPEEVAVIRDVGGLLGMPGGLCGVTCSLPDELSARLASARPGIDLHVPFAEWFIYDGEYGWSTSFVQHRFGIDADTAHDVAIRAEDSTFKAWLRARISGSLVAYLRRSVRNRAVSTIRSATRRPRHISLDDLLEELATDATVDHDEDLIDFRRRLQATLERMRPRDRAIIELRVIQGRSHQELADQLGVPAAVASTWLSRARRRFREHWTIP